MSLPDRWSHLGSLFTTHYGTSPSLFVRAPGRVNLIGEHTDYNGLPVLPVALQQEVALALRPRDDARIRVANAVPAYGTRDFRVRATAPPGPAGDWGNYLMAPARHLAELHGTLAGFDAVLDSAVPVAAGVSSSAALVVAVGLALDAVNGLGYETLELAEAMARAERFVGTQGGGMDQAISLGARAHHAARIDFGPLRMTHVPVPAGWRFVVAHTLVQAEKSGAAREAYNRRTRECREALEKVRPPLDEGASTDYPRLLAAHPVDALLDVASDVLDDVLLRRFRHVITEGHRVGEAETALRRGDCGGFGVLMDASHHSLRDDYEVSSPELDCLVELAREAGAGGARLTGAGFGGCIVALTGEGEAPALLDALEEGYYGGRADLPPREKRLFVVEPGEGATAAPLP